MRLILTSCGQETPDFTAANVQTKTAEVPLATSYRAADVIYAEAEYKAHSTESKMIVNFNKEEPRVLSLSQIKRDTHSFFTRQGQDAKSTEESFPLTKEGELDILLVIDDSDSMTAYQNEVASKLAPLLTHISNSNWQIAVVTTSESCLRNFGKPLTKQEFLDDPIDFENKFRAAVSAGDDGDNVEKGIEMAIKGINGVCHDRTKSWTRPLAKKAILMLSDEENCGSGSDEGCDKTSTSYYGTEKYAAEVGNDIRFYGILHDQSICTESLFNKSPQDYLDLVNQTGGISGAICQSDYTNILEQISFHVSNQVITNFELSYIPDVSKLKIKVSGNVINNKTSVIGQVIQIHGSVDETQPEIAIEYEYGYRKKFNQVELTHTIDPDTVSIEVNDQAIAKNDYTILSETKTIIFKDQPIDDAKIVIQYKSAIDLADEFEIPKNLVIHELSINGNAIQKNEYKHLNEIVKFDKAPTDESEIEIKYNFESDYTTNYDILTPTDWEYVESTLTDEVSGNEIPHTIEDGVLVVAPSELMRFDSAVLKIETPVFEDEFELGLSNEPIENSITFSSNDCVAKMHSKKRLKINCKDEKISKMNIGFHYYGNVKNIFELEYDPNNHWFNVEIDGIPTRKFSILDNQVVIEPELLNESSRVVIYANKQ